LCVLYKVMQVIFYGKPDTVLEGREFSRLISDARSQFGEDAIELRDTTSRDSIGQMEAYQIVKTPAVLIIRDDGAPVALWQHTKPSLTDISYYYQSRS
jgi:hypothetical protein